MTELYSVGDKVECLYDDGEWYSGRIVDARRKKYDVKYDDGDFSSNIGRSRLRKEIDKQCYCQKPSLGQMVACETGSACRWGGLFHLDCLQLMRPPRGDWRCRDCEKSLQAAIRKATAEDERIPKTPDRKRGISPNTARLLSIKKKKNTRLKLVLETEMKKKKNTASAVLEPELTVECAERQSREFVDSLLSQALPCTFEVDGSLRNDNECEGLCRLEISSQVFKQLQRLHELVVHRLNLEQRLTSWAGVDEGDARARGYAFLPSSFADAGPGVRRGQQSAHQFGESALRLAGVHFHAASKTGRQAQIDERANWRSCVTLDEHEVDGDIRRALNKFTQDVRSAIPRKYKSLAHLNNLHAIQPNLHNGLDHLPPHLDYPLHDGFGVVIVTVCVQEDAHILIVPHGDRKRCGDSSIKRRIRPRAFECKQGQAYILTGNARNACDHGVVCPLPSTRSKNKVPLPTTVATSRGRQSLNLRFGLHSDDPGTLFYAKREMPQLYEDD